jgi:uncharacterized membrane protein
VTILMWMYVGSGGLLALLSLPLLWGKIPPNPLYGFRVPATLANRELWYAVNRYAAKRLLVTGLVVPAAAVALTFIPGLTVDAYALACLGMFVVAFSAAVAQSVRYMNSQSR